MLVTRKHNVPGCLNLAIEGEPLQSVDSMKYLGITITSDLNWSTHIKNQCSKAKKLVGLLYRRYYHYSNSDTLIKLYLTLVRPHLEYACQVWDPYLAKNRSALESVQKFALRMCMKQWDSSYNDLLDVLNLPTLEARRRNLRLSTLYNLKKNLMFFSRDLLKERHAVSRLDREQLLVQPFARCHNFYNSFVPRTIREWNNLSSEQVQATSTSSFKLLFNGPSLLTQLVKFVLSFEYVYCTCNYIKNVLLIYLFLGVTIYISLLAILCILCFTA